MIWTKIFFFTSFKLIDIRWNVRGKLQKKSSKYDGMYTHFLAMVILSSGVLSTLRTAVIYSCTLILMNVTTHYVTVTKTQNTNYNLLQLQYQYDITTIWSLTSQNYNKSIQEKHYKNEIIVNITTLRVIQTLNILKTHWESTIFCKWLR